MYVLREWPTKNYGVSYQVYIEIYLYIYIRKSVACFDFETCIVVLVVMYENV